jgi:hypothetical protein
MIRKFIGGQADGRETESDALAMALPFRCGGGFCFAHYKRSGDDLAFSHEEHRSFETENILSSPSWELLLCRQWAESPDGRKFIAERRKVIRAAGSGVA